MLSHGSQLSPGKIVLDLILQARLGPEGTKTCDPLAMSAMVEGW